MALSSGPSLQEKTTTTKASRSSPNLADTEEIYLDANATVRPLDSVVTAVVAAMRGSWGNPSSEHGTGIAARSILEQARDATSLLLEGIEPDNVVLTSGGTEGSNTVLGSAEEESTIIVTAVEHPATMMPAERARRRGARLVVIPVGVNGQADPEAFRRAAAQVTTTQFYVSVQWANGETGVIQPVAAIAEAVCSSRPDAFLHVDAAQAVGRIHTPVFDAATAFTFSGHKIHGPQGTGVLAFSNYLNREFPALLAGGGQEKSRRSGTQNVAGAAGLAAALKARAANLDEAIQQMGSMRDAFESRVLDLVPHAIINGAQAPRTPNTSNIRFPGIDGMSLVARLDALGIRCSQGSACSSGRPEPSQVLRAMGIGEQDAYSSVRFSFSILNTEDEVEKAAVMIANLIKGEI